MSQTISAWTTPLWKDQLHLEINTFVFGLYVITFWRVRKWQSGNGHVDGLCSMCVVPEYGTHIFFMCPNAPLHWNYVCEALGPEWLALDLGYSWKPRQTIAVGGGVSSG